MTEIELKAHAAGYRDCKFRLDAIAGPGLAFTKDDGYWFPAEEKPVKNAGSPANLPRGLRVRRERHGSEGSGQCLVTYKTKERREGIEINSEQEFEVSSGECFEELLERLGLEKRIYKHKQGWSWNCGGITAELMEVEGTRTDSSGKIKKLGWFIELEILVEGEANAATAAAARKRLLELLEKTGLGEESIESRYYSQLLSE
jgi:adenylate cyclase class 2